MKSNRWSALDKRLRDIQIRARTINKIPSIEKKLYALSLLFAELTDAVATLRTMQDA